MLAYALIRLVVKIPLRPVILCRALRKAVSGVVLPLALTSVGSLFGQSDGGDNPTLEIRSVTAGDKAVTVRRNGEANLGTSPDNIVFVCGPRTNVQPIPIRIRYKLEGYDSSWRDGASDMYLMVRFYNAAGDQVGQKQFPVTGESAGWNGSLVTASLTHRRETIVVPEQATRLWVIISSAGPPAAIGVYVVANLVVSKMSSTAPPVVLMESPFDYDVGESANRIPAGWARDGNHSSMANIVAIGQNPAQRAFAILDDDASSHAEWHNIMEAAPQVTPGDQVIIEWNEAFSIGMGTTTIAQYQSLREGTYRFHVAAFDIFGNPTGADHSISVHVPPPLWRMPWFWGVTMAAGFLVVFGVWRYLVWRRVQQEMLRLRQERVLENERLRIAQDLHDDFGARVTEISLASALAKKKQDFPESASADFDRISSLSRELVSALYETVWAVNPENDNLDALGNYLCQVINRLCEQAQLSCRLRVAELPHKIQVSSQTRHNVIMAAKEAVHNVIKHARATELALDVTFADALLTIVIQDNGCGFQPDESRMGNGLTNMQRRLADLGGTCEIQSRLSNGTKVILQLSLRKRS